MSGTSHVLSIIPTTKESEMAQVKVKVTVDTNGSPTKIEYFPKEILIKHGKETIEWTQAEGSADFAFAALAFDHPNPFSDVVVNDRMITALDDNHATEDHRYAVLIRIDKKYYSSKSGLANGGPIIRNK
jgi:hypothetical protein